MPSRSRSFAGAVAFCALAFLLASRATRTGSTDPSGDPGSRAGAGRAAPGLAAAAGSAGGPSPDARVIADASGRPSIVRSRRVADATGSTPEARAYEAARSHLRAFATLYGLEPGDADALVHRDTHLGRGDGAHIVRFRQAVAGRPILGAEVSVVQDRDDALVAITGRLVPARALRQGEAAVARAHRTERDALVSALGRTLADEPPALTAEPAGGYVRFVPAEPEGELRSARARAVAYDRDGSLVPAHHVELELGGGGSGGARALALVVAEDGAVLRVTRLDHADTFRVHADPAAYLPYDSPAGTEASPHPTGLPDDYEPPFVASSLVTLSNYPFSQNDPWLPPGAVELSGNGVFAWVETEGDGAFDPSADLTVPATAPATYDYAYDTGLSPTATDAQGRAAATQLFYVGALLHDLFYDAGFDESAGNAQASNHGRGGEGGDRLRVVANDPSLDGASVAVIPSDGSSPRLAFGIYPGATADEDRAGAMDGTLVAHEWGHLLSERLVGDGLGLGNAQGRAIGEGTSDFVALLLAVRDEDRVRVGNDLFQGVYAVGGYVASASDANGHYYGLRRAPYSTHSTRNGFTFAHVARGAALPATFPMRPSDAADNPLPHHAGEIWGLALWECYASLLNAHPYAEAFDRMRSYLVGGLRAMPFEPTFVEAREAMLAVAAATDPADASRFSVAFAKRGLGEGASAPPRSSTDLVTATPSFVAGNAIRVVSVAVDDSVLPCDADGVLDVGETGRLRVTLANAGAGTLAAFDATVAASGATAALAFPGGDTLSFPSLEPGATATRTLLVELTSVSDPEPSADLTLTLSEPSLPVAQTSIAFDPPLHHDEAVASSVDAMSAETSTLSVSRDGGALAPFESAEDATDRFAHLDDGPSRGTVALVTPPLAVTSTLGVSFRIRHSLVLADDGATPESGAVLELSEDGVHFTDVADLGADPAYGGALPAGTESPLGARDAFTGASAGFPAFLTRSVDLGAGYAGKTVYLRFRVGSAGGGRSAYGVDVDDLEVTGVDGTPFAARVAETSDGIACNVAPVLTGAPDVAVDELAGDPAAGMPSVVTLSVAESFDPDGTPLTFAWTHVAGPAVILSAAGEAVTSFEAPDVATDTLLVFRVDVSDGTDTSSRLVRVTIRHANRSPTAVVLAPATVEEGTPGVVLDGSGSTDPDGDALAFTWTQTGGPAVALAPGAQSASFDAPSVDAETPLEFSLVVADGAATSSPATATVIVVPIAPPPEDAGVAPIDAGSDAGPTPIAPPRSSGRGCSASPSAPGDSAPSALLVLCAAVWLGVRRRRARPTLGARPKPVAHAPCDGLEGWSRSSRTRRVRVSRS